MAKALTKSQIVATVADQVGMTKKQAVQAFDLIAELAYKQAKNTFTLPGIGKLVLVNRPARTMTMQFGQRRARPSKSPPGAPSNSASPRRPRTQSLAKSSGMPFCC